MTPPTILFTQTSGTHQYCLKAFRKPLIVINKSAWRNFTSILLSGFLLVLLWWLLYQLPTIDIVNKSIKVLRHQISFERLRVNIYTSIPCLWIAETVILWVNCWIIGPIHQLNVCNSCAQPCFHIVKAFSNALRAPPYHLFSE